MSCADLPATPLSEAPPPPHPAMSNTATEEANAAARRNMITDFSFSDRTVAALVLPAAAAPTGVVAADLARLPISGTAADVTATADAPLSGGRALDDVAYRRPRRHAGRRRPRRRRGRPRQRAARSSRGRAGGGDLIGAHRRRRGGGVGTRGRRGRGCHRRRLSGRCRRLLRLQLHVHEHAHDVALDVRGELLEGFERLALVLEQRVLLAVADQPDALTQVVHLGEVGAPLLVDDLEHHPLLDVAHQLGAVLLLLLLVMRGQLPGERLGHLLDSGAETVEVDGLDLGQGSELTHVRPQPLEVPALAVAPLAVGRYLLAHDALDHRQKVGPGVGALEDLAAFAVDHLALLVHDVV